MANDCCGTCQQDSGGTDSKVNAISGALRTIIIARVLLIGLLWVLIAGAVIGSELAHMSSDDFQAVILVGAAAGFFGTVAAAKVIS